VIDFRYHLVSIIAVFFALAVGIVLGAGPLGARVDENLPEQLAAVREENQGLRDQIRALEADQEFRDGFVDVITSELVRDRLTGRQVLMVSLPDADGDLVDATGEMLELAGATVTTTITIDSSWSDPESEAALDALATELVSAGTTLPERGNGYDRGAALLAGAFLRAPIDATTTNGLPTAIEDGAPAPDGEINEEVVVALREANFIEVTGEPEQRASLAVVVDAPIVVAEDDDAAVPPEPLLALVAALDDTGSGSVITGPASSADSGGLIDAVRQDDELSEQISTVDSLNLPGGRIAVVFAIVEQQGGSAGQYGYVGAVDGPVPPIPARPLPSPDIPPGDLPPGSGGEAGNRGETGSGGGPAGSEDGDEDEDGT
jgi:hypothetical protein